MTQPLKTPTARTALQDVSCVAIDAEAWAAAERKRRQDDLLDLSLLETVTASDPISVMLIT